MYGVPDKLKDFLTSKKDIREGIEVNPQENFRLKDEDVFEENPSMKQAQTQASSF